MEVRSDKLFLRLGVKVYHGPKMLVNSTDLHKNSGAEIKYFLMEKKENIMMMMEIEIKP